MTAKYHRNSESPDWIQWLARRLGVRRSEFQDWALIAALCALGLVLLAGWQAGVIV